MGIEIQDHSRNLICLLQQLNKKKVFLDKLSNLIQCEDPAIIKPEEEVPVLIIDFKRAGFQITAIKKNLQIISIAPPEAKTARDFAELTQKVLEAFGEHEITAYGFNFSYTIKSVKDIAKHFNIKFEKPKTDEWLIIPSTSIKLMFDKADTKFTLNVADGPEKVMKVDVNVHHEEALTTNLLSKKIALLYNNASKNSLVLVKAVLGQDE